MGETSNHLQSRTYKWLGLILKTERHLISDRFSLIHSIETRRTKTLHAPCIVKRVSFSINTIMASYDKS